MCDLHASLVLSGCYASVRIYRRQGWGKKSKHARKGSFSTCNREQLCKTSPLFDKDKGEVRIKGKRLTPLYRRWEPLCSCMGSYCYCCSQILLSPVHIWWMNHLAIGQAGSCRLCYKQKGFLATAATSALPCVLHYPTDEKSSRLIPIYQLTRAGNNLQTPFTASNIITSWDLPWNCLETPGCSICCFRVHLSDNMCAPNTTRHSVHVGVRGERSTHGFTLHFCHHSHHHHPPIPCKKKKWKQSCEASSRECIAPAKQSLFN